MSRPENFHEVWLGIIKSIDRIVKVVRPLGTLMLSLDGVCPRAKVHDQKRRRPGVSLGKGANQQMPKMEEDMGEEVVEEANAEEAVAEEILPLNPDKEDILPLKPDLEEVKTEVLTVEASIKEVRSEALPLIKPSEI
jgi:5'-3' exonuclease